MKEPYIIVRRHPYEEPFNTRLECIVSNGVFAGAADIYCNVQDITAIGKALKNFPSKADDEYHYEYGSEDPAKKCYRYFLLRAYTIDKSGHCALQIAINLNVEEPEEGECKFSIRAEAAAINRLGELLEHFGKLSHLELQWDLKDGQLYKQHQLNQ